MAHQEAPLKLEMKDVVFVKPSNPIPSSILSLSHIDNRPDVNALCPLVYVYRPTNHDSPNNQLDPISVIKEALSKALVYYYPLAGRLVKHVDGKYRVHFNADDDHDHGVPFLEADANCHLSSLDYLDGNDIEISKHLAFDLPTQDQNGHQYPLLFKVTKFLCGGFTIGWSVSHVVVDGFGGAQFFRALAELASGKSEPSLKPVWERERVLVESITKHPFQHPMGEAKLASGSPFLPTTDHFIDACFKVDHESITRLKKSLMKESHESETKNESFTTFESLAAYVWRSRARALNLNNDGKTVLIFLVGVRMHLVDPPLPKGYYGNAFVDAYIGLTVKELNEKPLSEIAKLIRVKSKVASSVDYIENFINTLRPSREEFNIYGGAYTALTDWRHVGFWDNMDLGGNYKLVNSVPAPRDNFGSEFLCIFCPPSNLDPSIKGGVRIFTSLPSAAMLKFKEEMEALKTIG